MIKIANSFQPTTQLPLIIARSKLKSKKSIPQLYIKIARVCLKVVKINQYLSLLSKTTLWSTRTLNLPSNVKHLATSRNLMLTMML